jgi:hypothetical protein
MESKWVTTLGGPHILIPQSACHLWNGAPRNYPDEEGDYGRACAVDDYVGLIDVGHARALVFADHPGRTTFLPSHGILLREIAGGDDDEVLEATLRLLPTVNWGSRLSTGNSPATPASTTLLPLSPMCGPGQNRSRARWIRGWPNGSCWPR